MKRERLQRLVILTAMGLLAGGCYSHRVVVHETAAAPAGEVVVTAEPPPVRHEVIGVAPSPRHVWVAGYWTHHHGRWVWVQGHYVVGPRTGAVWVPGHWDRTDRGWVWTAGHWE